MTLIPSLSCILALLLVSFSSTSSQTDQSHSTFIIHVSHSQKPALYSSHRHWYSSILRSLSSPLPSSAILYTYDRVLRGFSARLSPSHAAELRRVPGILDIVPDKPNHLHTTRTPRFLGLADSYGLWPNSEYADDVIIGVLDTGIWPERASFSDEGLSAVPSEWKGKCEISPDFPASACNRKIIGARAYYKGYLAAKQGEIDESVESKSPRDTEGHGTHTASTAAGSRVANASLFGYARGEARGMATKARIGVYKICWSNGCYDSDILAAMDQAVADGVHVISLSVGSSGLAQEYYRDSIAIGAFGAVQHGVVVSCSAGNSGPNPYSATNIAPWILTVGASTIDREFPADVVLGDGRVFRGVSLYSGEGLSDSKIPLVYFGNEWGTKNCYMRQLDPAKVAGKIVICDRGGNARVQKGAAVKLAGGVGMILANTAESGEELLADAHLIPATAVGQTAGDSIRSYVATDASPTATIVFKGTVTGEAAAPGVTSFSSRGPNHLSPEILKPDVIAPGLDILAAWTGFTAPTDLDIDPRRVEFNIISGTSMSCPHVSGLAALLRKAYPEWTPSALKSALITTAYTVDNKGNLITDLATGNESTPFVQGAGHVDPNRALNPGLIYDIKADGYVAFLCAIGYDSSQIGVFVGGYATVDCEALGLSSAGDLNYPSFGVIFRSKDGGVVKQRRVVTNVGSSGHAVYEVKVVSPPSVEITVSPTKLVFGEGKTASYEVTFTSLVKENGSLAAAQFGAIEWSDGEHLVRSPVAVQWHQDYLASE